MTIKIEISHFYDYREPKQLKKKNKIGHFFMELVQIRHHTFIYQKILKYFSDFQNQNF